MAKKSKQNSKTELASNNEIRSKCVIKHSSVSPANFVQLQSNVNLNLAPSNWLSNVAESYGLRHLFSSNFSSFKIANILSDYVGDVDIVSDSENIKNLLKMRYSKKSVSMIVHRINNTLLLDEFDVHKHLLVQKNDEWEWLRKFFNNHIIKSSDKKEKCVTCNVNTFDKIQQKCLYSKFLHYTLADQLNSNKIMEQNVINPPLLSDLSSPKPIPDEEFSYDSNTHQLFNNYVLWNFENLQMLLGTNLPIFKSDQNSSTFLSSRLRNILKPLSVSTAIDYWLDNLFCNIPEVVMCYHLNGFVQKYEYVKTESLPNLNNSKFSPQIIKNIAQNVISFLKSNTSKSGHTYWLFKGKNDDDIKLYNLTSVYLESLVKGCSEGHNPFTVPVAMLLYRVVQTSKYNTSQKIPYSLVFIKKLLDNCLKNLNKTMYPQIVTSVQYILSDVYIPQQFNPESPKFNDIIYIEKDHVDPSDTLSLVSDPEKLVCHINLYNLCFMNASEKISKKSKSIATLKKRCQKALYYIACGLSCLQYFENADPQNACDGQSIVKEMTDIEALVKTEHSISSKIKTNKKDAKNQKCNKQDIVKGSNGSNISEDIYYQPIFENMLSLHKLDPNNSDLWKQHLSVLLYEKACLSYAALAENEFICKKYGQALKHIYFSYECQRIISSNNLCSKTCGFLIARLGDFRLTIALNWDKVDQFKNEIQIDNEYDLKIWKSLIGESDCTNYILEADFYSRRCMLKAAECSFLQSLQIETNKNNINNLYDRLSRIYNEYIGAFFKKEIELSVLEIHSLSDEIRKNLVLATYKFKEFNSQSNIAAKYLNSGNLHRGISYYIKMNNISTGTFKNDQDYIDIAIESFKEGLTFLGSRSVDSNNWDALHWELSETIFSKAIEYHNKFNISSGQEENEKEVIELFLEALKYCNVDNDLVHQSSYQFRSSFIHQQLAYYYFAQSRSLEENTIQFRSTINQCILHYNSALDGFSSVNCMLNCLEVTVDLFVFNRYQFENTARSKVEYISFTVNTVNRSVHILQKLLKNDFTSNANCSLVQNEHEFSWKKNELLIALEYELQVILKSLIKIAIVKSSKLTDKLNVLKTIYGDLLRRHNDIDICTYLLRIITQISKLKLKI